MTLVALWSLLFLFDTRQLSFCKLLADWNRIGYTCWLTDQVDVWCVLESNAGPSSGQQVLQIPQTSDSTLAKSQSVGGLSGTQATNEPVMQSMCKILCRQPGCHCFSLRLYILLTGLNVRHWHLGGLHPDVARPRCWLLWPLYVATVWPTVEGSDPPRWPTRCGPKAAETWSAAARAVEGESASGNSGRNAWMDLDG